MNRFEENEYIEFPYGLSVALSNNPQAYQNFMSLDEKEQNMFLARAQAAQSRAEIQSIVKTLEKGG